MDSKATDGVAAAESVGGGGVRPGYGAKEEDANMWGPAVRGRKEKRARARRMPACGLASLGRAEGWEAARESRARG